MKSLTKGKMWCYAIGQLGWSIISGLIGSWLVYFYQPSQEAINEGMISLIPQGRVVLGILTIIGLVTAIGRVFDAVTDPARSHGVVHSIDVHTVGTGRDQIDDLAYRLLSGLSHNTVRHQKVLLSFHRIYQVFS